MTTIELQKELMQIQFNANNQILKAYELAANGANKVDLLKMGNELQEVSNQIEVLTAKINGKA